MVKKKKMVVIRNKRTSIFFPQYLILGRGVSGCDNLERSINYVKREGLVITWQEVGVEDVGIVY